MSSNTSAWFNRGDKTYDECIINGMRGIQSDIAAEAVKKACREKFPTTENQLDIVSLPRESLREIRLTGRLMNNLISEEQAAYIRNLHEHYKNVSLKQIQDFMRGDIDKFRVNIYNGSKDYTLTKITISIHHNESNETFRYTKDLENIKPNSNGTIYIESHKRLDDFNWHLVSAQGYRK